VPAITLTNCVGLSFCLNGVDGSTNHSFNSVEAVNIEKCSFKNTNFTTPLNITIPRGYYFRANGIFVNKNVTTAISSKPLESFFANHYLSSSNTTLVLHGSNVGINASHTGLNLDELKDSVIINSIVNASTGVLNISDCTAINSNNATLVNNIANSLFINSNNCKFASLNNGAIMSENINISLNATQNILVLNVRPNSLSFDVNFNNNYQSNTVFAEEFGVATSTSFVNKRTAGVVNVNVIAGGSVTINTTRVYSNKLIFLTPINVGSGSAAGAYVSAINNGASFTITFPNAFNGQMQWIIINTVEINN